MQQSKIDSFPSEVIEKLGYYVYAYLDPRSGKPFYIGKGRGNRAFQHLGADNGSAKAERLSELALLHLEPRIDIIRYSLTEEQAFHVEAPQLS